MEKIIQFAPAYDKRTDDPKTNYGIGAMRVFMILKGTLGAVHFVFSTGIFPENVRKEFLAKDVGTFELLTRPMGYDVGVHSLKPQFEGQQPSQEVCQWLGVPCYCDGSAMRAETYMNVMIAEGSDKIWEMLEEDYKSDFGELV